MDVQKLQMEARLSAIEYFIAESFRMIYQQSGISIQEIEQSHAHLIEHLRTMEMPGTDPVASDIGAQELQESHGRLSQMILNAVKDRRT